MQDNGNLQSIAKRRGSHFGGPGTALAEAQRVASARKGAMKRHAKNARKKRFREVEGEGMMEGLDWDEASNRQTKKQTNKSPALICSSLCM